MAFWESVLIGAGLGVSLAAPPGPIFAKLGLEVSRGRNLTGFMVGVGATSADMTFFLLVAFGILEVLPDRRVLGALGLGGVVVMNFFAYSAWKGAREPPVASEKGVSGFVGGYLLAVTSPFNWIWWLTSGVPFVALYGPTLGVGFFVAILAWVVLMVGVFHWGSRRIARFELYVGYASAALLVAFALFLAYNAIRLLAGGAAA